MVTEEGIVQSTDSRKAHVLIQRLSCCAGCHGEAACRPSEKKEMVVEALNDLHAREGDRVRVSVPSSSLVKVTFLVYFLPVLSLIFGAALGSHWGATWGADGTLPAIASGTTAMLLTFLALRAFDRGAQQDERYWPRITQVLRPSNSPTSCSKSDRTASSGSLLQGPGLH